MRNSKMYVYRYMLSTTEFSVSSTGSVYLKCSMVCTSSRRSLHLSIVMLREWKGMALRAGQAQSVTAPARKRKHHYTHTHTITSTIK